MKDEKVLFEDRRKDLLVRHGGRITKEQVTRRLGCSASEIQNGVVGFNNLFGGDSDVPYSIQYGNYVKDLTDEERNSLARLESSACRPINCSYSRESYTPERLEYFPYVSLEVISLCKLSGEPCKAAPHLRNQWLEKEIILCGKSDLAVSIMIPMFSENILKTCPDFEIERE
ncbi:MAG: hypothetical protein ABIH37_00520 [archaeon]